MALRSTGSLTISFGLVSIPVKLYTAQSENRISFNLLHEGCGSRLKQQYICEKEQTVVETEKQARGYEFAKGQYVQFSTEELKAMDAPADPLLAILGFVPLASVDPLYFDKGYLLAPDKGAAKGYHLLSIAMNQTGRAAVGRYAARGRDHLVILRSQGENLIMHHLYYADEVRGFDQLSVESADQNAAEVSLAVQLIEQTAAPTFNPAAYKDERRDRIQAAIQQKVESGATIQTDAAGAPRSNVINIADALRASIEAAKPTQPTKETKVKKARKARV